MKNKIVSVSLDGLKLLRNYPYLILPYLINGLAYYYLIQWKIADKTILFPLIVCYSLLVPSLMTTYLIALIYKKKGIFDLPISVWSITKKYYEPVFVIYILSGIIIGVSFLLFLFIFLLLVGVPPTKLHVLIFALVGVPILGPVALGSAIIAPLWVVYYGGGAINAIRCGYQELRTNFLFYYLLFLFYFIVGRLPILLLSFFQNRIPFFETIIASLIGTLNLVLFALIFIRGREKIIDF